MQEIDLADGTTHASLYYFISNQNYDIVHVNFSPAHLAHFGLLLPQSAQTMLPGKA